MPYTVVSAPGPRPAARRRAGRPHVQRLPGPCAEPAGHSQRGAQECLFGLGKGWGLAKGLEFCQWYRSLKNL